MSSKKPQRKSSIDVHEAKEHPDVTHNALGELESRADTLNKRLDSLIADYELQKRENQNNPKELNLHDQQSAEKEQKRERS
ncbi:uncharacterized protein VTP21DRAFT_1368 [Calcarisporiella thermophila]|uniref:uncharacterized protein n=1 Tax=Calcarisporiella thermophila TaxID=911321 RepID=UPI0037447B8B